MPCFKTLSLRIDRPGKQKREWMDTALLSYTRALEQLLRHSREPALELAQAGGQVTRAQVQALADAEALKALNVYGVQPFKDALKQEFCTIVMGFIARWRKTGGLAGYPCVRLEPGEVEEHIRALVGQCDRGELSGSEVRRQLSSLLSHSGRIHPLYFGRYATHRDYCLLYNPDTGRFYAKLHLLNAKNRLPSAPLGQVLRVVAPGLPPAQETGAARRFIVVPLAFGKEQETVLHQALDRPQILRTARLVCRGDAYVLVLSVEVICNACVVPQTTMGVTRTFGGLTCTVCDREGQAMENIRFPAAVTDAERFCLAKEITARAKKARARVVLEAGGGRGDGLALRDDDTRTAAFPVWDYVRLGKILQYKLLEAGLPPPAFVSGSGLNTACPRCGAVTRRNRLSAQMFACVSCGYAAPFEFIGSHNLALKLRKYAGNKVPIYVREENEQRHYENDTLGFSCTLPAGSGDAPVLYELSLMAKGKQETWCEGKKYAMLCKLRAAVNIRDAVRWVKVE